MTTTCLFVWAAVLLTLPIVFLLWLTESREQRIRRWHRRGMSQRQISEGLGCTRYRVRQALA
jgi:hypothetical protein